MPLAFSRILFRFYGMCEDFNVKDNIFTREKRKHLKRRLKRARQMKQLTHILSHSRILADISSRGKRFDEEEKKGNEGNGREK
jgi:hypothetical protein